VSEGRRSQVIADIARAIGEVYTVRLLNTHSDPDHNRTVYTFIGPPEAVKTAAYGMTEKAIQLIDINAHEGVHPYIGAVDVIPFVPIMGITIAETVELARSLGDEISHELKLPVYFYGYAALREDRRDLPVVRRGGYSKLKEEIKSAERHPDYGEAALHPRAGAVAIGVRDFLIAFNIDLDSADLNAAREIAKSVRETHGGLPGVRAIGVLLDSRNIVQISMNITDHRETTLKEVMDFVSKKAAERGIGIKESEIVGMVPKDAVFPNMDKYLKLPHFDGKRILNNFL
jgi:glutamate formiminotransferase